MREHEAAAWFIDRKYRSQPAPALGRAQHQDYENQDYDLGALDIYLERESRGASEHWRYLFVRDSKDFATEGEHKNYWDGVTEYLVEQILGRTQDEFLSGSNFDAYQSYHDDARDLIGQISDLVTRARSLAAWTLALLK